MRLLQMAPNERVVTVAKLGSSVTIAYASTYYILAILAKDIAQSLGHSVAGGGGPGNVCGFIKVIRRARG